MTSRISFESDLVKIKERMILKFKMKTALKITIAILIVIIIALIIAHIVKAIQVEELNQMTLERTEWYENQIKEYKTQLKSKDASYNYLKELYLAAPKAPNKSLSGEESTYEIIEPTPVDFEPEVTVTESYYVPVNSGYLYGDSGFRSYEPYTAIGAGSIQEQILWHATPDENGIMSINGRPLVAIGTGWGYWLYDEITVYTDEGSYDCIVGDIKDDAHTNWTNKVTSANGCVVEFIVDLWKMSDNVRCLGTMSTIPKYHGYVIDIIKTGEVNLG